MRKPTDRDGMSQQELLRADLGHLENTVEILDVILELQFKLIAARPRLASRVAGGDDAPCDEILLWEARVAEELVNVAATFAADIGASRGRLVAAALERWREQLAAEILPKGR